MLTRQEKKSFVVGSVHEGQGDEGKFRLASRMTEDYPNENTLATKVVDANGVNDTKEELHKGNQCGKWMQDMVWNIFMGKEPMSRKVSGEGKNKKMMTGGQKDLRQVKFISIHKTPANQVETPITQLP
ncbi:hypothetical protein BDQ17DRAFT_1325992 [Cyathus striatus]|nr:hypothetical protein BDQ17DRAFT_1325992 [Cyathus striatus]